MAKKQSSNGGVYQIKITLKNFKPPIWRRVELSAQSRLDEVSEIILDAMGWNGYHLHQFIVGHTYYSVPDPDEMMDVLDETEYVLADILHKEKSKCVYEYDFGDGWEHEIVLEKILAPESGVQYPRCTAGKMACPPEDCGGVWGYAELLAILKDPEHDEHESYVDWLGLESGEDYDPTEFILEEVNERLRHTLKGLKEKE